MQPSFQNVAALDVDRIGRERDTNMVPLIGDIAIDPPIRGIQARRGRCGLEKPLRHARPVGSGRKPAHAAPAACVRHS